MSYSARMKRPFFCLGAAVLATLGCGRLPGAEKARHMERATDLYAQQRFREAAAEYDSVLRLEPDNPIAVRQLALARYRLGDVRGAYPLLVRAQARAPRDAELRLATGFLELARGERARARQTANAVLAGEPRNLEAYRLLGVAWLAERQPANAENAFRNITSIAPTERQGHQLVGVALLQQGRRGEAATEFESALKLSPEYVEPLARLVEIALAEKRPDAGLARVRQQVARAPGAAGQLELLGIVYLTRRDTASAETAFRRALELDPRLNTARVRLTQLYTASGRPRLAEANLLEAVKANPGSVGPLLLLALTYEQNGDLAAAQRWAEAARNAAPTDPGVADAYGWILYRRGLYARALPLLQESTRLLPANPGMQYHLGMTYSKLGQSARAREALQRALQSSQPFPGRADAERAVATLE